MEIKVKDPTTLVNYTIPKKDYRLKALFMKYAFKILVVLMIVFIFYLVWNSMSPDLFMRPT